MGRSIEIEKFDPGEQTNPESETIRLTPKERAKLEEMAAWMTLNAYVRACLFAEEAKRRPSYPWYSSSGGWPRAAR